MKYTPRCPHAIRQCDRVLVVVDADRPEMVPLEGDLEADRLRRRRTLLLPARATDPMIEGEMT